MSRESCRLLQISGNVELHDFVVASDGLVGAGDIRHHRIAGRKLQFLRLGQRVAGTRDLALVAVEDRQVETHEDRSRILGRQCG